MFQRFCPECNQLLTFKFTLGKGQQFVCPECEARLLVINEDPLELIAANRANGSKKKPHVIEVSCITCDHFIHLKAHVHLGQRLICSQCGTHLEVIGVDPLEVDVALPVNVKRGRDRRFDSRQRFDDRDFSRGRKRR